MRTLATIKPGETFIVNAQVETVDGSLVIGAADKFKCQIRDSFDELIADVQITEVAPGQYLFKVEDTAQWPVKILLTDILYRDEEGARTSETLKIKVIKGVTKDV